MKSLLLFLIIQILTFLPTSCFECSSITNLNQCKALQDCSWDSSSSSCKGTFSPSCPTSNCYYIDSYSTAASSDGTPEFPLKTLTDGFKKLATIDGTLVILNYKENTTVDVTQATTISTNVTIMPLFEENGYSIDFNKIPVASTSYTTMITISKQLTVIGATFQNMSSVYKNLRIFALKIGILVFKKVEIHGLNGLMKSSTWQIIYDSTFSSSKSSSFYFLEGKIVDTSARFIVNGPSYWQNVQILNYQGSTFLTSAVSLPVRFNNCSFIGGDFDLVQAIAGNVTIENSVFTETAINVFALYQAKQILISNSTFENITLPTTGSYFMKVELRPAQGDYLYLIQDTIFRNIFTPYPLLTLVQGNMEFSLVRVRMENITLNPILKSQGYRRTYGTRPVGICITGYGASLNIESSNFTNIGEDCLGLTATKFQIKSLVFNNSMMVTDDFLTKESYKTLTKDSGITWVVSEETPSSEIVVQGNRFLENKQPSLYGGALRITGIEKTRVILIENQFIGNMAVYGGAVYIEGRYLRLSMKNNILRQNFAVNGGAIYKTSLVANLATKDSSFLSKGDIFQANAAFGNGGSLYLDWESFTAKDSQFLSNPAENGGAIYFINLNGAGNNGLANVIFKGNSAAKFGGALKLYFDYSDLRENQEMPLTFENNLDMNKNAIHDSRPSYYQLKVYYIIGIQDVEFPNTIDEIKNWLENPQNAKLRLTVNDSLTSQELEYEMKQKSGQKMSQILSIQIMDSDGKVAKYIDDEEKIKIQIASYENNISNKTSYCSPPIKTLSFSQGQVYIYNDLKIEGEPKTKATLNIKSIESFNSFLTDSDKLMNFDIQVNFMKCAVGEIFNNRTKTCDACQENSFSFDDPYNTSARCFPCVSNAYCLGRSIVLPNRGFWRFHHQTTTILESHITSASSGGYDTESGQYDQNGFCVAPYTGNKCDECIEGYAHFGSRRECFDCSNPWYYVVSTIFLLMQLGVIFALFLGDILKKTGNTGLIKVIISFIQMNFILFELRFKLADFALNTIWGLNKVIPLGKDGFVMDCFLNLIFQKNIKHFNFIKIVVVGLVQPLLFWTFLILCCKIYFYILKKPSSLSAKKTGVLIFMIICFVLQPYIIQTSLEVLKCQNYTPDLEEANYFMQENSNVRCFTRNHYIWSILPGLIMTFIWGLALPFLLFKNLIKDPLYKNFFCEDFKNNKKYWELLVFTRKILIIIIANCAFDASTGVQLLIISPLILLFLLLQWTISPYKDPQINSAELASLFSSFLTTILIFLIASQGQNKEYVKISNFFSAIILIFVFCFYLQIILIIVKRQKKLIIYIPEVPKSERKRGLKNEDIIKLQKVENRESASNNFLRVEMSERDRELWEESAKIGGERQRKSPFKPDEKKNIQCPRESHHFRSISSLEIHGSEESNLLALASPRTFREDENRMEKIELVQRSKFKDE